MNGDGLITAVDALLTINYLNNLNNPTAEGEAAEPAEALAVSPVAAVGVAVVATNAGAGPINAPSSLGFAASQVDNGVQAVDPAATGVVETVAATRRLATQPAAQVNHLDDVLSLDDDWLPMVSDVDRALQTGDARDTIFARLGA